MSEAFDLKGSLIQLNGKASTMTVIVNNHFEDNEITHMNTTALIQNTGLVFVEDYAVKIRNNTFINNGGVNQHHGSIVLKPT